MDIDASAPRRFWDRHPALYESLETAIIIWLFAGWLSIVAVTISDIAVVRYVTLVGFLVWLFTIMFVMGDD